MSTEIPATFHSSVGLGAPRGSIELETERIAFTVTTTVTWSDHQGTHGVTAPKKLAIDLEDLRDLSFFSLGRFRLRAAMTTPFVFRREEVLEASGSALHSSATYRGKLVPDLSRSRPARLSFRIQRDGAKEFVWFLMASDRIDEQFKSLWLQRNRRRMWTCLAVSVLPLVGLFGLHSFFAGIGGFKAMVRARNEEEPSSMKKPRIFAKGALVLQLLIISALVVQWIAEVRSAL